MDLVGTLLASFAVLVAFDLAFVWVVHRAALRREAEQDRLLRELEAARVGEARAVREPRTNTWLDALLERSLDRRVERVQPEKRQRFGRGEAPARDDVGAVVGEDAVAQRERLAGGDPADRRDPL